MRDIQKNVFWFCSFANFLLYDGSQPKCHPLGRILEIHGFPLDYIPCACSKVSLNYNFFKFDGLLIYCRGSARYFIIFHINFRYVVSVDCKTTLVTKIFSQILSLKVSGHKI